jgi:hypothetical protein
MAESRSPRLIDISRSVSPDTLLGLVPEGRITACDFYVSGAETGLEVPGGYQLGRILNIDHHAPAARMARQVSSTNLALEHLAGSGDPAPADAVVINHTDCDNVLSAALLCGLLEPDARYGAAAIAADHTGQENPIADLLQALDPLRDFEFSLNSLTLLERGQPLSPTAAEMVRAAPSSGSGRRNSLSAAHSSGEVAWPSPRCPSASTAPFCRRCSPMRA